MSRPLSLRALGAGILLVAAGYLVVRQLRAPAPGERTFFYDVSARKIFAAPRQALPPIRGVDGPEEDAFRALVISTNGKPADRGSWHVAYLEKYTPELRQKMAAAQESGAALAMGRFESQANRFVRRPSETNWHAMTTDEGDAIVSSWARPGPDGITPVVCAP